MLVLSAPPGVGKTTIYKELLRLDSTINFSVSYTTRPQRSGETNGVEYRFVNVQTFEDMIRKGEFIEYAKIYGNYYGTPKGMISEAAEKGNDVLFELEWQGFQKLAETSKKDIVSIFILPPSWDEMERRLRTRAKDTPQVIAAKLEKAAEEIGHCLNYDYVIVNQDIDESVEAAMAIIKAERMKRWRQTNLSDLVERLIKRKA